MAKNLTGYRIHAVGQRIVPGRQRRLWMDETHSRFAYRCLPLTIANAMGWEILLPARVMAVAYLSQENKFRKNPGTQGINVPLCASNHMGAPCRSLKSSFATIDQGRSNRPPKVPGEHKGNSRGALLTLITLMSIRAL